MDTTSSSSSNSTSSNYLLSGAEATLDLFVTALECAVEGFVIVVEAILDSFFCHSDTDAKSFEYDPKTREYVSSTSVHKRS